MTSLDAMPDPSGNPSPEQVVIGRGIHNQIHDAMAVLAGRAIFSLRYVEQLDIHQIANRLCCSEGNVRPHLPVQPQGAEACLARQS